MTEQISKIAAIFLETDSLEKTAKETGLSTGKIRKILLTEGLWSNDRSSQIETLLKEGLTIEEIADKLEISTKTVSAYMPYTKGEYEKAEKSVAAECSKRWRDNKALSKVSDRVLSARHEYPFVTPSSRDILVQSGYFQFNLSKLIALTKDKEPMELSLDWFTHALNKEEEEFDEPAIVLEYVPFSIHSKEEMDLKHRGSGLVLLNNSYQVLRALERGETTGSFYVFRMEEFLPYITKHFTNYVSYWNGKLKDYIEYEHLKEKMEK